MNPQKFGRLTLIREVDPVIYWSKSGYKAPCRMALYICDCGTERVAAIANVLRGATKSCGCLKSETDGKATLKHGMSKTPIYGVWLAMRRRCGLKSDPYYMAYGGRGIKVCERWQSFENFYDDMGPRPSGHTIERVDTDGDYCPENCRWATNREQQNNKRNNRRFEYLGRTQTIQQWCEELDIPQTSLHRWLVYKGMTMEEAVARHSLNRQ